MLSPHTTHAAVWAHIAAVWAHAAALKGMAMVMRRGPGVADVGRHSL